MMNITKDEARLIASALEEFKYRFEGDRKNFDTVENLEFRFSDFSTDKRRTGRKSMNDFWDLLKRLHEKRIKTNR